MVIRFLMLATMSNFLFCPRTFGHDGSTNSSQHALEDEQAMKQAAGAPAFELVSPPPVPSGEKIKLGEWGPVISWPHIPVSAANLADGRILTFASNKPNAFPDGPEYTYATVWNPTTGAFLNIPHTSHDMFCSHSAMLPDGRVLVNGGRTHTKLTSIFDPAKNLWVKSDPMVMGRWYPTTLALPDGRVFTAIGSSGGNFPEVWAPGQGWKLLNGINFATGILNYTNYYEQNWTPHLVAAPDGHIAHLGPTPRWHELNPQTNGSIIHSQDIQVGWYPKDAAIALFDVGKVLIAGGSIAGNNGGGVRFSGIVDITKKPYGFSRGPDMTFARRFANSVVLPTGEVMVVGGSSAGIKFDDTGAILQGEIYSPATSSWRLTSPMTVPRTYHSVALLLHDGRVLSGGGGLCGGCTANHADIQIYSPGYLFDENGAPAPRPTIVSDPKKAQVGQNLSIQGSPDIVKFSLIRLASVTHSNNTDQRFISVPFVGMASGDFSLSIPEKSSELIPGMYMLFALNSKGVPSVARTIQIEPQGAQSPLAPILVNPASRQNNVGDQVAFVLQATDPGGLALVEWSAQGLPTGVGIDRVSGKIAGTVQSAGQFTTTVTVKNEAGVAGSASFVWAVTPSSDQRGTILEETWSNISGVTVESLTTHPSYPTAPSSRSMLRSFASSKTNSGNLYGKRLRGYLYPPVSGSYQFWLASDDYSRLLLSSDDNAQTRRIIASVNGWTQPNQFNRYPSQTSAPIVLQAGKKYYIEVLMKEHSGGDHFSVAWRIPGKSRQVISGQYLSPVRLDHSPLIISSILDQRHKAGDAVSIPVSVFDPDQYDVVFDAKNLPQGVRIDPKTGLISGVVTGIGGFKTQVIVKNSFGTQGATEFNWDVAGPPDAEGYLLVDYFDRLNTSTLEGLRKQSMFPWRPDAQENITLLDLPKNRGQQFGALVRGYLSPPVSGQYQFWVSGDDAAELWLSTDESPYRKIKRASVESPTLPLQWDKFPGQKSSPVSLEAGKKYYLEIIYVQSTENAHLAVAWQIPGAQMEIISGHYLSPYLVPLAPQKINAQITFKDGSGRLPGMQYKWDFGDGSQSGDFSSQQEATHSYTKTGRYVVTLSSRSTDGKVKTKTFVQVVHNPQMPNPPATSSAILFDGDFVPSRLWNVNSDSNTISVSDATTLGLLAEIPVGVHPVSLAKHPQSGVWVTVKGDSAISLIDNASLKVLKTISLSRGSAPEGIAISPKGDVMLVVLSGLGVLEKRDAKTGDLIKSIPIGPHFKYVSISWDGQTAYLPRFITERQADEVSHLPGQTNPSTSKPAGGEVVSVNIEQLTLGESVFLAPSTVPDAQNAGRGVPNYLGPLVLSPDGLVGWVPSKQDNIQRGIFRDKQPLTHDSSVRSISSLVNIKQADDRATKRIDYDNGGIARHGVFDPTGAYFYVALEGTREISIVDHYGRQEIGRVTTGRAPQALTISPDGRTLYSLDFLDRAVTAHDLSKMLTRNIFEFPKHSQVVVQKELLTPSVLNGKRLFYDSRDPRLALEGYLSCAACHNDGGHDGRTWDITGFGEGLRNTISLVGHGGMDHGRLHWSANFDEVQDFEGQIRGWALGLGLMNKADFEKESRSQPLGLTKAGISQDLDDLAAYVGSLKQYPLSPFRKSDGHLTESAQRGQQIFQTAQCGVCHSGPHYTDSPSGKLHDIGTIKVSTGKRLNSTLSGLDTPTLLNLWETAPYLHDGSALSLQDAIKAHKGVNLDSGDLSDLETYLLQLEFKAQQ